MTDNRATHTFQPSEQPRRIRTAAALNRGVAGRRASGAGTLNLGDEKRQERDEEIRKALGMIRSGLDILLDRFGDGEPISLAELLEGRAERFGGPLTEAETDVLARYAEGESADAIAQSRGVAKRTIDNQIAAAIRKLGFRDRRELTGYIEGAREALARRRRV